jgi:hypothetical protein
MQVNELMEFLEYCHPTAHVAIGIVGDGGEIDSCSNLRFLADQGRVYLVAAASSDAAGHPETKGCLEPTGIAISDYESPQIFGKHLLFVKKQAPRPDAL